MKAGYAPLPVEGDEPEALEIHPALVPGVATVGSFTIAALVGARAMADENLALGAAAFGFGFLGVFFGNEAVRATAGKKNRLPPAAQIAAHEAAAAEALAHPWKPNQHYRARVTL